MKKSLFCLFLANSLSFSMNYDPEAAVQGVPLITTSEVSKEGRAFGCCSVDKVKANVGKIAKLFSRLSNSKVGDIATNLAYLATICAGTYYGSNGYPVLLPAVGIPATLLRVRLRFLIERIRPCVKYPIGLGLAAGGFASDVLLAPLGLGPTILGPVVNDSKRAKKKKLNKKAGRVDLAPEVSAIRERLAAIIEENDSLRLRMESVEKWQTPQLQTVQEAGLISDVPSEASLYDE